jgi:hypothetical protein
MHMHIHLAHIPLVMRFALAQCDSLKTDAAITEWDAATRTFPGASHSSDETSRGGTMNWPHNFQEMEILQHPQWEG